MRRWELPVFSAASIAAWIAVGCYPVTISKGEGHQHTFRFFEYYSTTRVSLQIIGLHLLLSLVFGLLAWGIGFLAEVIATRTKEARPRTSCDPAGASI